MKTLFIILSLLSFINLNAQDAETLFKNAESQYSLGNYEAAIKGYTDAIKLDETHINSYLRRGFTYIILEKYNEAISDFSKVIEFHPNHKWAYLSRGSAYNKVKEYKKAILDFDAVLKIEPENEEAFNNRGWAKKFLGDTDGACDDWKISKKLGNAEAKIILKNNNCK